MVVVDILGKVSQFILVKTTYLASEVAHVFISEIMILDGVSKTIVSNMDDEFTFKFRKETFAGLGIDLAFSIAYHS